MRSRVAFGGVAVAAAAASTFVLASQSPAACAAKVPAEGIAGTNYERTSVKRGKQGSAGDAPRCTVQTAVARL